jgi:DNA-binding transcriptional LysR family regulator
LIDRFSREALPTKAGELLYEYARRLIALRDETESALAEFQGQISGRLVIGGSTIPSTYILPRIIGAFTNKCPEVTIALHVGDTDKIIKETLAGVLELSIVGYRTEEKRIFQEKFIEDNMRLIVPRDHKWARKKSLNLNMLFQEPFIAREAGSGTLKSIQNSLGAKGHRMEELKIIAEMGSTEAVIQGIKNKVGVSILSTLAVSEDLQSGDLKAIEISGLNLRRLFYLTLHRDRTPSPLCNAFLKFLKKEEFNPPI